LGIHNYVGESILTIYHKYALMHYLFISKANSRKPQLKIISSGLKEAVVCKLDFQMHLDISFILWSSF